MLKFTQNEIKNNFIYVFLNKIFIFLLFFYKNSKKTVFYSLAQKKYKKNTFFVYIYPPLIYNFVS